VVRHIFLWNVTAGPGSAGWEELQSYYSTPEHAAVVE
jgi:hypothetical protein